MNDFRQRILIVDDERLNINVMVDLLKADHKIMVAKNGEQALRRALSEPPPDLILLDIIMPGMDGYQVCERLKADGRTRDIPVVFVTAMGDVHDETRGLEIGAVDYITKPISPPIVKARVKTHLTLRRAREFLKHQNQILENMVGERTKELALTQDVTILCMASLAETRDKETGYHIRRTQSYVLTRFGLLALVTMIVFQILGAFGATFTDPAVWYAGYPISVMVLSLGVAVWGFFGSIGDQPLLRADPLEGA